MPLGAAHTFMTYKKDYTPGGGGINWSQMQLSQHYDGLQKIAN